MSTMFYAGPCGNYGASKEIAFRENQGLVHWKDADSLRVCPCCFKPFAAEEIVAHDEYGHNYTYLALIDELGQPGDVCPLCYHHVSDPAHEKCVQERSQEKGAR